MATIRKFQFDLDFDAEAAAASAVEAEEPPPPPTFSEAELAEARQRGFAEGRTAGLAEAAQSAERQTAMALAALGKALEAAGDVHQAAIATTQSAALTLAAAVARKLVPQLLRSNAVAAVEAAVTEILPQVIEEPRLVIRADDSLIDALKEPIDALTARTGFAGKIILLGDERIRGTDCRIEWADGGAEHDIDRLIREVEATVDRFLHGVGHLSAADEPLTHDTQEISNG